MITTNCAFILKTTTKGKSLTITNLNFFENLSWFEVDWLLPVEKILSLEIEIYCQSPAAVHYTILLIFVHPSWPAEEFVIDTLLFSGIEMSHEFGKRKYFSFAGLILSVAF